MVSFEQNSKGLFLSYTPERDDGQWLNQKLAEEGEVMLSSRVFSVSTKIRVLEEDSESLIDSEFTFKIGEPEGDYFRISANVLGIKHDLCLSKSMTITRKTFVATRGISIFRHIDRLTEEPIVVGGDHPNVIPIDEFERLLRSFPTSTELDKYSGARISRILQDYLETMTDAQRELDAYLERREEIEAKPRTTRLLGYEIKKFEYAHSELAAMLEDGVSDSYKESAWQKLILEFILLLFPKYVAVLENLKVRDFYSELGHTNRFIDIALVDGNGFIDIIEIKRPFHNCLLLRGKYRDNFLPKRELSGTIMQVEKYIFHLKKWGQKGEFVIRMERGHELPPNLNLSITNPKGLIIIGRDRDFSTAQRADFEVIKRKYANLLDIVTYDDLLSRLENVISRLRAQLGQSSPNHSRHSSRQETGTRGSDE